ncbi:MAG TPA: hypothetical protein VLQ89_06550, partial [Candidatus Binatia bacterium]|nr:hypothetical protein [Candidatus Binatia bacterium]
KLAFYHEVLGGYFNSMSQDKDQPVDLDWGEITPVDIAMNGFDPSAHLSEDLFQSKLAFISLLNFPVYSLAEKTVLGAKWDRRQWAYARMGGSNPMRLPAEVNQEISRKMAAAGRYISDYNIFMGSLVGPDMKTLFPADMKLISHWGIRDELKARYADKNGLARQKMIFKVMERIVRQEIPAVMVNSGKYQWDPFSNTVYENRKPVASVREADDRYRTWLSTFQAMRLIDTYSPLYPTHIRRSFDVGREIPEQDVEAMFTKLLASPQVKKVAALVRRRLGRKLQPFDIWYNGFKGNAAIDEEELDKIVAGRYPTTEAFEKDMPRILLRLGFSQDSAAAIVPHIQVDPARGSGHNSQTQSRLFKSRLRTRIGPKGMNYKGYSIALHEMGHAVENVLDLYRIDYFPLAGVPNTAFTEAIAYVFQDRALDILGIEQKNPRAHDLQMLDSFWNAYEIMGVSLLDMTVWRWLVDHPQATAADLKQAVLAAARDIWNKYFAGVFGVRDQIILAVYSHMIDSTLYLPDYAIGHVIQVQIEEYLREKTVGPEIERMVAAGNVPPQFWMKNAVGGEIAVEPMLQAVERALKKVK